MVKKYPHNIDFYFNSPTDVWGDSMDFSEPPVRYKCRVQVGTPNRIQTEAGSEVDYTIVIFMQGKPLSPNQNYKVSIDTVIYDVLKIVDYQTHQEVYV